MPASTVSLGSLSSPSPSPPPPDHHPRSASNSAGAGLDIDSGSELSELTEEEQENDGRDPHASDSEHDDDNATERPVPRTRKKKGLGAFGSGNKGNKKGDREWRSHPVLEEEEEEEPSGPAKAMEEEEDDDQEPRSRGRERELDDDEGPAADRAPAPLRERMSPDADVDYDGDSGEEDGDDEDEGEPEVDQDVEPDGGGDLTDDEGGDDDEDDPQDKYQGDAEEQGSEVDDGEPEDVEMQDETQPTSAPIVSAAAPMAMEPMPPPPAPPMPKAQSSIMAGSAVIEVPLSDESASPSPSSSRSASPEPDAEKEDREQEQRDIPQERKQSTRASRSKKNKSRSKVKKSKVEGDFPEADGDADAGNPTPDVDDADLEGDGADADDGELDAELESDLQPAHRAEALDVLAGIELKFALLRERLYVEKMDNLAWEENLVAEGTHPEMLHLHAELSKRRNKRLELATRRRDHEIANVNKRRKLDEDAVWSWWQCARDDLQTEMISETNRKRRRLERERRALERPRPERYIPPPPLELFPAPTLREIVKGYPYGLSEGSRIRHGKVASTVPLQHPELSVLNTQEVVHDLEWLFSHRRQPVMHTLPPPPPQGAPGAAFIDHRAMMPQVGPGMHQSRTGYNKVASEDYHRQMAYFDDLAAHTDFGPGGHYQHAVLAQQMQGPGAPAFFPGPALGGRQAHPSFHPSQVLDQDVPTLHRPASASVHLSSHHPQHSSAGPSHGPGLMRRSISPVPVHSMQNGQGHPPMNALPMHSLQAQANGWDLSAPAPPHLGAHEPRRTNGELHAREREKEREHRHEAHKRERAEQRELERAHERELERLHHAQMPHTRPHSHQLSHQHVHAPPGQTPHHLLGPHHHHHHHHHVVHHHHGQSSNSSSTSQAPMVALPPPPSAGPSQSQREFETRRAASGAPEVIEVSASKSMASPHWKSPEEQPEMPRERGRPAGPPPVGPHERIMTPFVMTPSQGAQPNYPSSPRNGLGGGPSTAPTSVGPSRRGSWSAGVPDDGGVQRPPSSASLGRAGQSYPREPPMTTAPNRRESSRPQPPSGQGSFPGSPRHNGRQLPSAPMSPLGAPAFSAPLRSPGHHPVLPPPPQVPINSLSSGPPAVRQPSSRSGSPRPYRPTPTSPVQQRTRPDPDLVRSPPPAPLHSGVSGNVITVKASDSLPLFPSTQDSSHPARLGNGPILGDQHPSSHMPGGPVAPPKPVPVDGP